MSARMPCPPLLAALLVVLSCVSAAAETCETQLRTASEGIVVTSEALRLDRLTAREALTLLGERGERSLPLPIRRSVPEFWRYKTRRSVSPRDLDIRYTLDDGNGARGTLRHQDDETQSIPVSLIPRPPEVLCSGGQYHIIAGGFDLHGLASDIGRAGQFSLEVNVDVVPR